MQRNAAQWAGLFAIVAAATLPFLDKAFHIDDPLYIAVARQILAKPWDPYGSEILWERSYESLFDADFNPPLWSYLLAGVMACTGEPQPQVVPAETDENSPLSFRSEPASRLPEIALHSLEAATAACAIVLIYLLSTRYVRWPLTATALVALSPAMLPGLNVMLEGPVMALWLGCIWCYLQSIDTDSSRWRWAAGLCAALGVLTKYTSGLVLLVIAIDIFRRARWRDLVIFVPAIGLLALWSAHNWFVYERLHALVIFSRAQTGGREPVGVRLFETWGRALAVFRAIGATTAIAVPVAALVIRRFGVWGTLLLLAGAGLVAWLGKADFINRIIDRDGVAAAESISDSIVVHVTAFGTLGAIALLGLAVCPPKRSPVASGEPRARGGSEDWFLWVWALLVIGFGITATPFLAVRHLLPGFAPLVWLTLRRVDDYFANTWPVFVRAMLIGSAAISSAAGLLIAKADYDFAKWYRHLALDMASRTVAAGHAQGKSVWFTGHWGWAYYAERAGIQPYIPGQSRLSDGDFLLFPQVQTWEQPPKELQTQLKRRMRPIRPVPRSPEITGWPSIDASVNWCLTGVRTISNEVHLYGSGTITVPWQFSHKPLDYFDVFELHQPAGQSESE